MSEPERTDVYEPLGSLQWKFRGDAQGLTVTRSLFGWRETLHLEWEQLKALVVWQRVVIIRRTTHTTRTMRLLSPVLRAGVTVQVGGILKFSPEGPSLAPAPLAIHVGNAYMELPKLARFLEQVAPHVALRDETTIPATNWRKPLHP